MNKKRILMLVVPVFLMGVGGLAAQTELILFQNLRSTIVRSENSKYVFALVPDKSVDEYVEESKADWRRVGYSEQEVRQKEEQLAGLIEKEKESRRKYSTSGLYEVSSGNRLISIDNFPSEIDSIFVANDGSYVVGFNGDITTFHFATDASIDEILKTTDQLAIYVASVTDRNIEKVCSVRIPSIEIADSVNRRSDSLYWADRERSVLLSEQGLLRIGKLNGDEILFDVRQCEILGGKRGESEGRSTMVSLSSLANESLTLTGEVKEIAITEEDSNTIKLRIGLDLTLGNFSESNIIVYKSDFALLNLILFTLDENGKQTHLYSAGGSASNYYSPETRALQKKLNQKIPPSDLTYVIKPKDSFNFSTETECVFLKSKTSASANEPWDAISKSPSPILIRLKLEMFPSYLKQNYSKSFSERILQDRWKKYGYLWLDDIVSEPVPIDLGSVVVNAKPGG